MSGALLNAPGAPATAAATNDTPVLQGLCTGLSDFVRKYTGREFWITIWTENRRGNGGQALFLRNRPVQSVTTVEIDNCQLAPVGTDTNGAPITNGNSQGFWNDDKAIYLACRMFCYSRFTPNVFVNYSAGYAPGPLISTPANFTVPAVNSNVALTFPGSVTNLSSLFPGSGTYFAPKAGYYGFVSLVGQVLTLQNLGGNPALNQTVGNAVAGSLIVAPQPIFDVQSFATLQGQVGDLYDAMVFEVANRYKELNRLGLKSQSEGTQETISYNIQSLQPRTKLALQQYRRTSALAA